MKIQACKHHHLSSSERDARFKETLERLRRANVRITKPRKKILEILSSNDRPVSVEEVHSRLKNFDLDLVTIYRTIQLLVQMEILMKFEFEDGVRRYELLSPLHHHHYIKCTSCGEIKAFEGCDFQTSVSKILEKQGYKMLQHNLNVAGICPACA